MTPYTGYGANNALLNELEELKDSARLRANDLMRDSESRTYSKATADAYAFCQQRLMAYGSERPSSSEPLCVLETVISIKRG